MLDAGKIVIDEGCLKAAKASRRAELSLTIRFLQHIGLPFTVYHASQIFKKKKTIKPDFWKSAEPRNCHRINWERCLNQTFQLAP